MYNQYAPSFGQPQANYNQPAPPRHSNVILVTGPDEAVMRTPNDADMLYIDQNKPIMYRVVSDMFGRKSLAEYPYIVPNAEQDTPVSRAEFNELVSKVNALVNPIKEAAENG